jgi:hypothetical protein
VRHEDVRLRFILLGLATACSSDVTADQACTRIAQDRCNQLQTCSASELSRRWGDISTCETRNKMSCVESLAAPKTAATPQTTDTCAGELVAETCDSFLSGVNPPADCLPRHGALAVGAACSFAAECSTGFCAVAASALCGACANPPQAGDSCATQGCGPDMICVAATQLCQVPVLANGACSNALPCIAGLACVGATASAMGSCMREATTAAATCDARRLTGPDCDTAAGLTCDRTTNQCVAQPSANAGQPCGVLQGVDTRCSGGATCLHPTGSPTGTCIAPASDGAACDTAAGPGCLFPARCVPTTASGTAGTCQLPGSVTCH